MAVTNTGTLNKMNHPLFHSLSTIYHAHPPLNFIHICSPQMTKTLTDHSDCAQKAADMRAKNAELTQRKAEQLASEKKGK